MIPGFELHQPYTKYHRRHLSFPSHCINIYVMVYLVISLSKQNEKEVKHEHLLFGFCDKISLSLNRFLLFEYTVFLVVKLSLFGSRGASLFSSCSPFRCFCNTPFVCFLIFHILIIFFQRRFGVLAYYELFFVLGVCFWIGLFLVLRSLPCHVL